MVMPPPPTATLFPYTTLFRSIGCGYWGANLMRIFASSPGWDLRWACDTDLHRARVSAGQYRVSTERSEEHTSELQSQSNLVCRLLLEKKNDRTRIEPPTRPGR